MAIERLKPLGHYALESHPTIFDEESLTALELCARTASKMNETIELLLKECKEQNITIKDAVDFMKDHLDESTTKLLYAMAENGELDILTQENFEAIRKNIVPIANVREYGATGDGVTDDTQAFKDAIASASVIYVPKGSYNITSTLEIPTYKRIYGEGPTDTIIKYNGIGCLFDISTNYAQPATIEGLQFTGSADFANSFLKCSTGAWGASFVLRDFRVVRFSDEVLRIESGFHCLVENGTFMVDGKSVITTFDGEETNMNFSNCNVFRHVFYRAFNGTIPVMFELFNARQLSFYYCQLEKADIVFKSDGKVLRLDCYTCWFEYDGAIYQFGPDANKPVLVNCTYVGITKFNGNAENVDGNNDYNIKLHNGSTRTAIDLRDGDEHIFHREWVDNPNDTYSTTWFPYKISTKETFFKHPVNTVTVEKKNTTSITYNLRNYLNYANINGFLDVTYMSYFGDASAKVTKKRVYMIRGRYYYEPTDLAVDSSWGSAKDATPTIAVSSEGIITATCDPAPNIGVLTIEYHLNHAKGEL